MTRYPLDTELSLAHATRTLPRSAIQPLIWSLTAALGACAPGGDEPAAGDSTESTTNSNASMSSPDTMSSADASTTTQTSADSDPGPTTTETSAGADAGEDTLEDGCWEYSGEVDYFDYSDTPPFEPRSCPDLPVPCEPVTLAFISSDVCGEFAEFNLTDEEREASETAARCVLESMRAGEPALHVVGISLDSGFSAVRTQYALIENGVLTLEDITQDLTGLLRQRLLGLRDDAWFEACLAAPDLEGLVPCLWSPSFYFDEACGATDVTPVDDTMCIGEEPVCPESG